MIMQTIGPYGNIFAKKKQGFSYCTFYQKYFSGSYMNVVCSFCLHVCTRIYGNLTNLVSTVHKLFHSKIQMQPRDKLFFI